MNRQHLTTRPSHTRPATPTTPTTPTRRTITHCIAITVMLAAIVGCQTTGLSMRERAGRDYSSYVHSLYDGPAPQQARWPLTVPANLAVAQIGEVSPPTAMIDTLRQQPDLFTHVQGLPAAMQGDRGNQWHDHHGQQRPDDAAQTREQMTRLLRLARDTGADYLLVIGGTIDYGEARTPLAAFDLTIVGAYLVPSREIQATGKASAALIDLQTNRVALLTTTTGGGKRLDSAAAAEGGTQKLINAVRNDMADTLTTEFIEAYRRRATQSPQAKRGFE